MLRPPVSLGCKRMLKLIKQFVRFERIFSRAHRQFRPQLAEVSGTFTMRTCNLRRMSDLSRHFILTQKFHVRVIGKTAVNRTNGIHREETDACMPIIERWHFHTGPISIINV